MIKEYSKFLAELLFVVTGFFWLFLISSVSILLIPEESLTVTTPSIDLILFIIVLIPVVYAFLFIIAFTWIIAFSKFFRKEEFIYVINKLGGPAFMRNYLIKLLNKK